MPNEVKKKPKKKSFEYFANSPSCKECEDKTKCQQCGFWMDYNQAIDEYEQWHKEVYEKPLVSLTPLGSEFVDNPERCFTYIKERLESGQQAKKDLVKLRKFLSFPKE